jgi:hypothetical protein
MFRIYATVFLTMGLLAGCSNTPKSASAAGNIRKSLDQSGLEDVSVSQDRDKGVVTLGGHVSADGDKTHAEQIARSLSDTQVIANEIAILPRSDSGPTKTVYKDLDKGIENNLDAALVSAGYTAGISYSVKNGVITLKGTVDDETRRAAIGASAQSVPNTRQVVNEIETNHQKATSTN